MRVRYPNVERRQELACSRLAMAIKTRERYKSACPLSAYMGTRKSSDPIIENTIYDSMLVT